MPTILHPEIYKKAQDIVFKQYKKHSAYRSGALVRKYKELGGQYADDDESKNLKRWFQEKWQDVGGQQYPVYRPTKRVNKKTPLTLQEIDQRQLKTQIELKQKIKGKSNLPKFLAK